MYWHWLGHPLCVVAGALTINAIITSITEPPPAIRSRFIGLEVNCTFVAIVLASSALAYILYILSLVMAIPNGGLISILWPLVLAESLCSTKTLKQLRAPDVVLAVAVISITVMSAIASTSRYTG